MKKNIFLLIFSFASASLYAQPSIRDYLSAPFPSNLVSSKNGKLIAWVFNDQGSRNIYSADADGVNVQRITNYTSDDGMDLGEIQLSHTGEQMIFVRGNAPNGAGEPANPAFLQMNTERVIYFIKNGDLNPRRIAAGNSPRLSPDGNSVAYISGKQAWMASLTDTASKPEKLFQSRGSQSNLQWSPDGKTIAFVSDRGDHSFIGIYDLINKTVQFLETSLDADAFPAWSPDGKQLAYIRIPNLHNILPFTSLRQANPWSIRLYNFETKKAIEVWKADQGKGSVLFTDVPSGNTLLWWSASKQILFPWEKDGWVHLYIIDPGDRIPRRLTVGNGEVENVTLSNDQQTIYYTTNIGDIDRRHIWELNISSNAVKNITPGKGIEWSPVETNNGMAFLHSSATRPAWPALLKNEKSTDIAVDLFPKDYPGAFVEPTVITITATDGIKTTGDLFLPKNYDPAKKYPAAIFLHGGSKRQMLLGFNYGQYYSNAYAMNQYLAQQGYIVMALNYRSGIGYGLDFREAQNYGAGGASEVKDLMAAGNYLQKRTDINPAKIALWGGSYGGYLTAHGLSRAPELFATGVDIHGVHNWNDELPTFAPWYNYAKFPEMAKLALSSSPVYFVKGWKAPVLMIHGDDDRNVPFNQSVDFAEILRKQKVHVEQLIFPDEVHSFLLHRNWVSAYEATAEFLNRELGLVDKIKD